MRRRAEPTKANVKAPLSLLHCRSLLSARGSSWFAAILLAAILSCSISAAYARPEGAVGVCRGGQGVEGECLSTSDSAAKLLFIWAWIVAAAVAVIAALRKILATPSKKSVAEELKLTPKQIDDICQEIKRLGRSPRDLLVDAVKTNTVVGIGETHLKFDPHRKLGVAVMPALKQAGATHLALELNPGLQGALDTLMKTGVLDSPKLKMSGHPMEDEYQALLKAGRDAGLKLVAVDGGVGRDARDFGMASRIKMIIRDDPKAKIIYWVGGLHVMQARPNEPPSATDLLREAKIKVFTVSDMQRREDTPLRMIVTDCGLTMPLAVPTNTAPFKDLRLHLPTSPVPWTLGAWDSFILYP